MERCSKAPIRMVAGRVLPTTLRKGRPKRSRCPSTIRPWRIWNTSKSAPKWKRGSRSR
jgi:hypothetical protein